MTGIFERVEADPKGSAGSPPHDEVLSADHPEAGRYLRDSGQPEYQQHECGERQRERSSARWIPSTAPLSASWISSSGITAWDVIFGYQRHGNHDGPGRPDRRRRFSEERSGNILPLPGNEFGKRKLLRKSTDIRKRYTRLFRYAGIRRRLC